MRNCGNCDYNDGCVYTSLPPKYKCTLTGEFHLGNEPCDVDFVPVVRCRECKYYYKDSAGYEMCDNSEGHDHVTEDGFCYWGERKNESP